MSTNCELCGYRDNEVKSGGAISEQGKRITLKVEDRDDLSRDVLKVSEIDFVSSLCSPYALSRASRVVSQYPRSISFSKLVLWEGDSQLWRVFSIKCTRNSRLKYLQTPSLMTEYLRGSCKS